MGADILKRVDSLKREVEEIYNSAVLPNWGKDLHGLPNTLYGYMMVVFSLIDTLSSYWKPNTKMNQTKRMIHFMIEFFPRGEMEAYNVAVQMWRHKLMHTGEPRYLKDESTGKSCRWLLHWKDQIPEDQHFTFSETGNSKILNLSLLLLIDDLKSATQGYLTDLKTNKVLQNNYQSVELELENYLLKPFP